MTSITLTRVIDLSAMMVDRERDANGGRCGPMGASSVAAVRDGMRQKEGEEKEIEVEAEREVVEGTLVLITITTTTSTMVVTRKKDAVKGQCGRIMASSVAAWRDGTRQKEGEGAKEETEKREGKEEETTRAEKCGLARESWMDGLTAGDS